MTPPKKDPVPQHLALGKYFGLGSIGPPEVTINPFEQASGALARKKRWKPAKHGISCRDPERHLLSLLKEELVARFAFSMPGHAKQWAGCFVLICSFYC